MHRGCYARLQCSTEFALGASIVVTLQGLYESKTVSFAVDRAMKRQARIKYGKDLVTTSGMPSVAWLSSLR